MPVLVDLDRRGVPAERGVSPARGVAALRGVPADLRGVGVGVAFGVEKDGVLPRAPSVLAKAPPFLDALAGADEPREA